MRERNNRRVDSNTEITIMNNTNGNLNIADGKYAAPIRFVRTGDYHNVTYDEFKDIVNNNFALFESLGIVVIDVYHDKIDYTIDDILESVRMKGIYKDGIDWENLEDKLMKINSDDYYNMVMSISKPARSRVIQHTVEIITSGKREKRYFERALEEIYGVLALDGVGDEEE